MDNNTYVTFTSAMDAAKKLADEDGRIRHVCVWHGGPFIIRLSRPPDLRGSAHPNQCECSECVQFRDRKAAR